MTLLIFPILRVKPLLELFLFLLVFILESCRSSDSLGPTILVKIVVRKDDSLILHKSYLPSPPAKKLKSGMGMPMSSMPQFEIEDRPPNDGTLSILPDLSFAFHTCYMAPVRTDLLIFIYSDEQFLEVVQKISEKTTHLQYELGRRYTHCEVYILNQTCQPNLPPYKITDFRTQNMDSISGRNVSSSSSIKAFPFDWLSDLYLIQYCESRQHLKFWEIYSAKNKLFVRYIYHQKFAKEVGGAQGVVPLNLTDFWLFNNTKAKRREDLEGLDIVASVFLKRQDENDNAFELKVGKDANGEDVLVSGLSVSILRDFGTNMNFTEKLLKIYFGADNYFVSAFTSDKHQFDLNLFHSSVTKNRSDVAAPLHPTFFDGVHAIFIQPVDQTTRNIYFKPFASSMWQALLATWTFIFSSCKLVMYLRSKLMSSDDPLLPEQEDSITYIHIKSGSAAPEDTPDEDEEDSSTFEVALWCLSAICQQGWDQLPSATSMRVIFVTSLVLSVVSYAAFTGKIVAELWSVPKPIKSLRHLFSYAHNVYLVEASDTSYDVLEGLEKRSPDVLEKIRFESLDKIYTRLVKKKGRTCVITWPDSVTSYIQEEIRGGKSDVDAFICETISSFSFQASSSLFVPKNSEFESLFNYRIIAGMERGFIRRYWNAYKKESFLSCLENNVKVTTLDFSHVFFAFFILSGGMIASVIVLVSELVISKLGWRVRFIKLSS